ncbi:MAG: Holliday junction branch migration protein RuvA [Pseudanabaenaceae cyanobacterium]
MAIAYLQGAIADVQPWRGGKAPHLRVLTLEVGGIGYEVGITQRTAQSLPPLGEQARVFVHLAVRDDRLELFGFGSRGERDFFRLLIGVAGIGVQVALALLEALPLPDLIAAIVSGNTRILSLTPGVGTKTAERLTLELKNKLADWREGPSGMAAVPADVELTLLALGYTAAEVTQAVTAVASQVSAQAEVEDWLKAAIAWLSKN